LSEIAVAGCDLAEVLGSAVALNLLFHIPLLWAVLITAADVLALLALQGFGMRLIEAVVLTLVTTIAFCFAIEIFALPRTGPDLAEIGVAIVRPSLGHAGMLTVAIGIIGATVMPHNLYLHSALVQTRKLRDDDASVRKALRWNGIDAAVLSSLVPRHAAILMLSAIALPGAPLHARASSEAMLCMKSVALWELLSRPKCLWFTRG
jgi:manganese transport protein